MSKVIRKDGCFQAARELRRYASENGYFNRLVPACRVANKELAQGRTIAVAVSVAAKVLRGEA